MTRTGVTRKRQLKDDWVPLGEALCRGDDAAATKEAAAAPGVKVTVLQEITEDIRRECSQMCRKDSNSLFKQSSPEDLADWNFDAQDMELHTKAPMLMTMLTAAGVNEQRMKVNTKKTVDVVQRGIVEAAGVLLYCRNRTMNAHQTLTALQLHVGLASQGTFDRLNKRGLCTEHHMVTSLQER